MGFKFQLIRSDGRVDVDALKNAQLGERLNRARAKTDDRQRAKEALEPKR